MPTALITGASRGLGAEIARQLTATHDLVLGGRPSPALDDLATELGGARTFTADLTDAAAVATAAAGFDSLDVLVHNAGVGTSLRPVADSPADEWRHILEVNLIAVAELTRLLLPAVRATRGHIVFINSGAGRNARANWAPYAASKFGLRALADSLRAEEPSIRVTSIFPGRIDTEMQREIVAAEGRAYDAAEFLAPSTVAATVVNAIATPRDCSLEEVVLRPTGKN